MSESGVRSESYVLCEGYHDRAFWAGWLLHFGCTDPSSGRTGRLNIQDPWGKTVARGQFAYYSKSGRFIRVVPCEGKANILPAARRRLKRRKVERLDRLVINVDADTTAGSPEKGTSGIRYEAAEGLAKEFDPEARATEEGSFVLLGKNGEERVEIAVIRWEAGDEGGDGIPGKETLERLVCASVVAAYPKRGPTVQAWLDSRDDPPESDPKEFAWSYMAGWNAELGCEAFYKLVWEDAKVAAELKARLSESGAWGIAESMAS